MNFAKIVMPIVGFFKRKERESKRSHENKIKEKEKKKLPPMKNKPSPPIRAFTRSNIPSYEVCLLHHLGGCGMMRLNVGNRHKKSLAWKFEALVKGFLYPFPAFCRFHPPEDEVATKLKRQTSKVNN